MAFSPTRQSRLPFVLHILLETPAAINFFLNPSAQLSPPPNPLSLSPSTPTQGGQAEAIIRQYAVLLFVSNIIAAVFLLRPIDATSKRVAGALAVYHVAPLVRAAGRIWGGERFGGGLGGPVGHFLGHGVVGGSLVSVWGWGVVRWIR